MTKITFAVIAEMMDYPSLSHFQARKLSPERLALLTPTERTARTRAQKLISQAKRHPKPLFAYPDIQSPPPPRSPHRDYLQMEDCSRDILRP
jgi:hypothetical protein